MFYKKYLSGVPTKDFFYRELFLIDTTYFRYLLLVIEVTNKKIIGKDRSDLQRAFIYTDIYENRMTYRFIFFKKFIELFN